MDKRNLADNRIDRIDRIDRVEILSPAGDLEKLKAAVLYGADAIYIGGQSLSLRAKAKNFGFPEMAEGIEFAHKNGVNVYIASNIFAHNEDLTGVEDYFKKLQEMGADALIISDPGIFEIAKEAVPGMEIHISTQANNTNYRTAKFWKNQGAARIVLARELSLFEISEIHEKAEGISLEAFVHGAMCISYSGRCLLSSFMDGRDANRGECSQPCRWSYNLVEEKRPGEYFPVYEDERGSYVFNSKDLCMIEHLPEMIEAGVRSFKIEGRMKTPYYVASTTKAYRMAVDAYYRDPGEYRKNIPNFMAELSKTSHREYTKGFYFGKTTGEDQVYTNNSYVREYDFIGVVKKYDEATGYAVVEQRNKFSVGEEIEVLRVGQENFTQIVEEMYDKFDNILTEAPHAQQILRIKMSDSVGEFDMLRKKA